MKPVYLIIIIIVLWAVLAALFVTSCNEITERGLKSVTEEIWYGENKDGRH